jgi:hypothetical protein
VNNDRSRAKIKVLGERGKRFVRKKIAPAKITGATSKVGYRA